MFVIEDDLHAEILEGRFETRQEAISELRRLAAIQWDKPPNRAPCTNWTTCGRHYELVEYGDTNVPWRELSRTPILEISAVSVRWLTLE